jgi:hypothetical protein
MKMEQMLACLLAKMEAKRGTKIKTIREKMDSNQEKMDGRQEEMKASVGSFAFWINVNKEEMKAMLDACLDKMEANPEEKEAIVEHKSLKKRPQ